MRPSLSSFGFVSVLVASAAAIAACSGSILPVVQENSDAGGGSSGSSGASSSGSSGSGSSGSSGSSGTGSSSSGSSGASSSGSSGQTGKDGGSACSADAGGNSCFCGDLICQGGQWVCGPCTFCQPSCDPGSVCVKDQIVGGAVLPPDDAGACPAGLHVNGNYCERDPTYACQPTPAACNSGTLDCACAGTLCTSQSSCGYKCESTTPGQVNCLCQVP